MPMVNENLNQIEFEKQKKIEKKIIVSMIMMIISFG